MQQEAAITVMCSGFVADSLWNIILDLRAKQALVGKATQEVEEQRARQQSLADMDRSSSSRPATSANWRDGPGSRTSLFDSSLG